MSLRRKDSTAGIFLGAEIDKEQLLHAVVPKDSWFGAEPAPESSYSLVGCSVAPGFDFEDFELAERGELLKKYPQHENLIKRLTQPPNQL